MVRAAFIISDIDKARSFEWIAQHLDKEKIYQLYILINKDFTEFERFLKKNNFPVYRLVADSKLSLLKCILKTRNILRNEKVDVVHCHLYNANIIGLIASWLAGIKKRIYTRHFSTLHHNYHPRAVKFDRFLNSLATDIIAISKNVGDVLELKEKVSSKKIKLIYHGFDFPEFENVGNERVSLIRQNYHIPEGAFPIIGIIARFTKWKGIQYIIPAFKGFNEEHPKSHLILANASGDWESEINEVLKGLPENSYTRIKYEYDNPALFHLFDMHIHTPIDEHSEAFGQTYVEALASGLPSIFTLSGIAREFIRDKKNAIVVPFRSSEKILDGMKLIFEGKYPNLWIENGKKDIKRIFPLDKMVKKLQDLYLN
jgi:glycosyltransferase involved in cell wall biosynthesis